MLTYARTTALVVALVLAGLVIGEAQISIPFNFSAGTTISSSQVNSDFSTLGTNALNRTGGTMTGTLTSVGIVPSATTTYDIGASGTRYSTVYATTINATTGTFSGAVTAGTSVAATTSLSAGTSLSVGTTTTLNSIAYTWPASQTASYFLQTNGSGTLTWALAGFPTVTATKVATYTAAIGEFVVCNGTFTVNLPASSGNSGKTIDVKNIGTGTITVDGNAAETIDGAATYDLPIQYQNVTLVSDGTNWYIR